LICETIQVIAPVKDALAESQPKPSEPPVADDVPF
jgi:hypothetical protein